MGFDSHQVGPGRMGTRLVRLSSKTLVSPSGCQSQGYDHLSGHFWLHDWSP